nr:hypothetical protein [Tanacetum cinerariifolium]
MDDPTITMEEYIMFEEEKARKRRKVFNWETAKYGKICYDEDVHDLRSVETEFPAIVLIDNLTSDETLSCEPMVSSLNDNEIDFRISFDESDDEDYMVVFDKNSFSYKTISANDLKTDSKNDNEKVNMPLFPSPELSVSCIDDLDFFKDFENEFPAIVYNDALTSKSNFSAEPTLCPQHINEFNLKDKTSLSECDKKEQNVLYFNDLFPFNMWHLYHPGIRDTHGLGTKSRDTPRISCITMSRDLRRYLIEDGLYCDEGKELFTSHAWRRIFEIRAPGHAPEKVTGVDLFYLKSMDRGTANVPYLLAQYLFRHDEGRKSGARLNICERVGAGTHGAAEDAPVVVEDAQADPTPLQAPQPPVSPRTMPQRIARLEDELMDASGRTYQAFDGTLVGSSQLPYHR